MTARAGLTRLAVMVGLLTVGSPSVLPMLPVMLGPTASGGAGSRPQFTVTGFPLSFTLLALILGSGQQLLGLGPQTVRDATSLPLVASGPKLIWRGLFQHMILAVNGRLGRVANLGDRAGPSWASRLLIGVSLGVVRSPPNAGPVTATLLTLATSQSQWGAAAAL